MLWKKALIHVLNLLIDFDTHFFVQLFSVRLMDEGFILLTRGYGFMGGTTLV